MLPTELRQIFNSANFYAGAALRDIFDPEKMRVLRAIHPHTRLSWRALSCLYASACSLERERVPGDVVTCGESIGPAAALISSVLENNRARRFWLFESSSNSSDLFRSLYLNPRGKSFLRGSLLPAKREEIGAVALLYLHGAAPTLRELYDQVVSGGFIFMDSCDRATLDSVLASRGARAEVKTADGGLVFIRKY
jgi:hypothetical protein